MYFMVLCVYMIIPEAIISDADGTLVDTLHLIRHGQYEAFKTYFLGQGIDLIDIPDYEMYEPLLNQTVGGSAHDTLERTARLVYRNQPHNLEDVDFDALHNLLNPIQDKIAPKFVKGYEGLPQFLTKLGHLSVKLAIFTSGTPHHIVRNIGLSLPELCMTELYKDTNISDTEKLCIFENAVKTHYAIPDFTVVTCKDVSTHKPDPESINLAMHRLKVNPEKSIVLGDHPVDMIAGVHANIATRIGVTHGFSEDRALIDAGATRVVHSLNELTDSLAV